jgi:hypothetical protein
VDEYKAYEHAGISREEHDEHMSRARSAEMDIKRRFKKEFVDNVNRAKARCARACGEAMKRQIELWEKRVNKG